VYGGPMPLRPLCAANMTRMPSARPARARAGRARLCR
jgi:hypothetical protein